MDRKYLFRTRHRGQSTIAPFENEMTLLFSPALSPTHPPTPSPSPPLPSPGPVQPVVLTSCVACHCQPTFPAVNADSLQGPLLTHLLSLQPLPPTQCIEPLQSPETLMFSLQHMHTHLLTTVSPLPWPLPCRTCPTCYSRWLCGESLSASPSCSAP